MMGLFPEIKRAWLTVDSDIYVWSYEDNSDLAYFDGLNETILSVGLVKPKPGVFHAFIKHLLVLTTAVDIIVLGITFTAGSNGPFDEIQLIPEPVFTIPTDGSTISAIASTNDGRLFLGSKEGSLFEIIYQVCYLLITQYNPVNVIFRLKADGLEKDVKKLTTQIVLFHF